MRKLFSLLAAVLFASGMMAETVDFSAQGYENGQAIASYTGTNFSVAFDKGSNRNEPKYYTTGAAIRCYGGNTLTVTSEGTIIQIVFTFASGEGTNTISANPGSFVTDTWTGSADTIVLTIDGTSGHRRIQTMTVVTDGEGGGPIVYDTLTVAQAIAIADTLEAGKNSQKYYIEGYAANVSDYNTLYNNQTFFLVDSLTEPNDSAFQAYQAVPEKDGQPYMVLAGDKLRLFGQLKKYMKDSTNAQLEVVNASVEFLEEVEGDRTIVEPAPDTITVARAMAIGDSIGQGKSTSEQYVINGYVRALTDNKGNSTADGGYAQYKNQTMLIADVMDSTAVSTQTAFMVYQAVASDSTQITKGAKISLKCAIKNYNGTKENASYPIVVTILERGEEPVKPAAPDTISVDSAMVIGNALAPKGMTTETYAIIGYVSKIDDNSFSTTYKNMTFWITNGPGSLAATNAEGAFCVYRGKPDVELAVGNKVLVTTQIQKYGNSNTIESTQNCAVKFLEAGAAPQIDTLTVAQAIAMADTLQENVLSEKKYYVIGFAANVAEYDSRYPHQNFYLVADSGATDSVLLAFEAIPTLNNAASPVLAGDKVCLYGALQKYVADSAAAPQLQVVKPRAEILEAVEGDRTIPEPKWDKITVAQAIEIGKKLADGGVSDVNYEITGYVSNVYTFFNPDYSNETVWIADDSTSTSADKANAFEIYRGKPNTKAEVGYGAKIKIVCKIKNYNGTIENDGYNISFEVLQPSTYVPDTVSVEDAIALTAALNDGEKLPKYHVVKGYIRSVGTPYDASKNTATFSFADYATGTADMADAYLTTILKADAQKVAVGSYAIITGYLMKKGGATQLAQGAITVFGEAPTFDTIQATPSEALAAGMELADNKRTQNVYVITGFVVNAAEYDPEEDDYQTFWLADEKGGQPVFRALKAKVKENGVTNGDQVELIGNVFKYVAGEDISVYVEYGDVTILVDEAIENIILTEKVQKVIVDGVLYIVRDGKLFNAQGIQVR